MTHHTVEGSGDPVVLLHGGMSDSTAWGLQVPALAEKYRTYTFDRRGHGQTPDTDAPFHYDDMADETVRFLEEVVGGPAHLVGWSDGGIVSLLTSIKRPDLVRRQVLMGANFHYEGLLPEFDTGDDPDAEHLVMIKTLYEGAALDPSYWPVFYAKSLAMWRAEPAIPIEVVRSVGAPTLVLVGDDDCIHHEHTVALFEALPDGQLAVVPGTSHALNIEKPALVNQLIVDFLSETEPPQTFLPLRRSQAD